MFEITTHSKKLFISFRINQIVKSDRRRHARISTNPRQDKTFHTFHISVWSCLENQTSTMSNKFSSRGITEAHIKLEFLILSFIRRGMNVKIICVAKFQTIFKADFSQPHTKLSEECEVTRIWDVFGALTIKRRKFRLLSFRDIIDASQRIPARCLET